ncbi:MAG: DUF4349 domain-containing protein [Chloroflexi bacterium]|nr:DUF4349 domain-containing protein [Chloroflexota bacterium]
MKRMKRVVLAFLALAVVAVFAACGMASDAENVTIVQTTVSGQSTAQSSSSGGGRLTLDGVEVDRPTIGTDPSSGNSSDGVSQGDTTVPDSGDALKSTGEEFESQVTAQQQSQVQDRIIIRTVSMAVIAAGVSSAVDGIAGVANSLGGWVVSSERSEVQTATISIRVPAARLDEAVQSIRNLVAEVESEQSNSRDVTDEYTDNVSRVRNLELTRDALTALFNRAETVEEALEVQKEITRIQGEIEVLQGRIQLLEQTSAYSLISVSLRTKPLAMLVNAGPDQTVGVGVSVQFRATFQTVPGINDYTFSWDFGDGFITDTRTRTAPTGEPNQRITATVTHGFNNEIDSPYIVKVTMRGTGDAGAAEGEDTVIMTVTRIPNIEVFLSDFQVVEEGQDTQLVGTLTRSPGLSNVTYTWEFGDGSEPETGEVGAGVTTISATHVYEHALPRPYTVRLTITADSEAGEVETSSSTGVDVIPGSSWTVGGWDVGNTWKSAVRALSALGRALGIVGIWLAIFSPVWLIIGGLIWWRRGDRPLREAVAKAGQSVSDTVSKRRRGSPEEPTE